MLKTIGTGALIYKYGNMSSGKSAMLISESCALQAQGIHVLCLKPSIDTRSDMGVIESRNGLTRSCISIDASMNLFSFIQTYIIKLKLSLNEPPKWVFVDESQFLTTKQVDELAKVATMYGIKIVCYGLRTDFRGELFDGSKRLFEMSDYIEEVPHYCACGNKTVFNVRINEQGEVVENGEKIVIGGDDIYRSVCRECYWKMLDRKKRNICNEE